MTTAPQLLTSASAEWYTPPVLVREIATFLSQIDLDPCADPDHAVPAGEHYDGTPGHDGLALPWHGRVYMNPPYGRTIGPWVHRFCTQPITEGVALVPARVDTAWFAELWPYPVCFIRGRLRFSGHGNSATFPSALAYRGPRRQEFAAAFSHRGQVVRAVTIPSRETE